MPDCSIIPVLGYTDVQAAIEWLCQTFWFKERWRIGNHRAQLEFDNGAIAISALPEETEDHKPKPQTQSLMVRITDVDKHHEHVVKKGARVVLPPADFPYGERQYTTVDIGGHIWTFSQTIADVAPEDWGGVSAK
ncbi:VOC family protein [Danxiaibacter flavus]|uniref:VOC family protein n=1 Tax=Danxiaibacter flavus TaxID=3049108 RepID=A0ABV3ZL20_9BACT|nr:VOC family protein [Chitinophagaceae bacterium DXS]